MISNHTTTEETYPQSLTSSMMKSCSSCDVMLANSPPSSWHSFSASIQFLYFVINLKQIGSSPVSYLFHRTSHSKTEMQNSDSFLLERFGLTVFRHSEMLKKSSNSHLW